MKKITQKKEIRILNRIVRISKQGLQYEADPRHSELITESLGLKGSTPPRSLQVSSPAAETISMRRLKVNKTMWRLSPSTVCKAEGPTRKVQL